MSPCLGMVHKVFPPGLPAPGVAEVSAFSWVVTTAIPGGAVPVSFTPRSAIALSRGIAEAGTGEPGTGTVARSLVNRTSQGRA